MKIKKTLIWVCLFVSITSCVGKLVCPSYGDTKISTKHGAKKQLKYARQH